MTNVSPSQFRRNHLNEELGSSSGGTPLVSSFFPLERYYEAADKVYDSFLHAYQSKALDDAYVYGKRYCKFCVEGIPKHNYYKSPKYTGLRLTHIDKVQQVLIKIEHIVKYMDDEELQREAIRRKQLQIQQEKRRREQELIEKKKYEELKRRMQKFEKKKDNGNHKKNNEETKNNNNNSRNNSFNTAESALAKLQMLSGNNSNNKQEEIIPPPLPLPMALPPPITSTTQAPPLPLPMALPPPITTTTTQATTTKKPVVSVTTVSSSEDEEEEVVIKSTGVFDQLKSQQQQKNKTNLPPPVLPPSVRTDTSAPSIPPPLDNREPIQSSLEQPSGTPPPPDYHQVLNSTRRNPFLGPSSNNNNSNNVVIPPSTNWNGSSTIPTDDHRSANKKINNDRRNHHQQQNNRMQQHQQQQQPYRPKKQQRVPLRDLRQKYYHEYHNVMTNQKRIAIQNLSTFQGKMRGSTNGCTVISALIVSKHLSNGFLYQGVTSSDIANVIDRESGPVLTAIRGKLGLSGASLIIPSDVHDHLVDEKLLHQEFFVGATGGDVLNNDHIQEVLKLLYDDNSSSSSSPTNSDETTKHGSDDEASSSPSPPPPPPAVPKKAGATFFFREHVISMVKVYVKGQSTPCYDLIDSLPGSNGNGTRTRCYDISALKTLLNYYTTKKFSEADCNYIDRNEWNENMADLDPRVFQAFAWAR